MDTGVDALLDAALAGRDEEVGAALASDPGLTSRSIHLAAALADAPAAFALLESDRRRAEARDSTRQWTPLLYVCCARYGRDSESIVRARVAIARGLLELGTDANAVGREPRFSDEEWRPLSGAAERVAGVDLLRTLIFFGAAIVKTPGVLLHAVRGGRIEVLRLLLDFAPADWYEVSWALLEAVVLDRRDMARMLIAQAAHSTKGSTGMARPALLEALRRECDAEFMALLLGDDTTDFGAAVRREVHTQAVRYGHRAAARLLEQRGAIGALSPVDRLIAACMTGDRSALQRILTATPEVRSALRPADHRMLAWAIRHRHDAAVPLLLEAGLDPNVPDVDGETPLHLASRQGSAAVVEMLLRAGARAGALNFNGHPALPSAGSRPISLSDAVFEEAAEAVTSGDLDGLRRLLDQHPDLVHARSPWPHRCTLLNYCGANGTERQRTPPNAPAIARLLLERGADPDATCNLYGGGHTTMSLMLTSRFPPEAGLDGELVGVLWRFGARLETSDLMGAIEYGLVRSVTAFVEAGVPIDNLFVAAGLGRLDPIERLLAAGTDINERYRDGGYGTALHAAAAMNQPEVVTLLLARGADRHLRNRWDSTPADTARFFGHEGLAESIDAPA